MKSAMLKGEAFAVEALEKEPNIFWSIQSLVQEIQALDISSMSPLSAPPVKSEMSEVLNAISMMGQIFKWF